MRIFYNGVALFLCIFFFGTLSAHYKIGITSRADFVGDREVGWRIKVAGEMLGWTVILDENLGVDIQYRTDLDWVISLLSSNDTLNPHCPNYQMIFHPFDFLTRSRELKPFYDRFDGFLLTINDRESIQKSLETRGKDFFYVPFYPSVFPIPYREVPLDKLVTSIAVWGDRLKDAKFHILYKHLSDTGRTKFYGVFKSDSISQESYLGPIPFDGISVIEVMQTYGIVLVLHSSIHNKEQIPSSRIFEAAAASAVIISDKNDFVIKNFGDSVYYINTKTTAQRMCEQIDAILAQIDNDPQEALDKARRAHEIFSSKFEMTHQLLELEAMHQKVLLNRKQRQ